MSNSLPIALGLIAITSLSVGIGYSVTRKSRRAGMTVASAGSLLAVVLIVNYFEEVPVVIVAARGFAAVAASMLFTLFEVARRRASGRGEMTSALRVTRPAPISDHMIHVKMAEPPHLPPLTPIAKSDLGGPQCSSCIASKSRRVASSARATTSHA